jgi:manganese transport protein
LQVWGFRRLEAAITGFVAVIVFAFGLNLLRSHPSTAGAVHGLFVPQFAGSQSVLLAVGIIGATVMPHVIYLHSSLTQKRIVGANPEAKRKIFRYEIIDITIAMGLAGIINLAMLATAAAVFHDAVFSAWATTWSRSSAA